MMRRATRESYADEIHKDLVRLRKEFADFMEDPDLGRALGIKVWVLPPWFYSACLQERVNLVRLAGWTSHTILARPRLLRLAELKGEEAGTSKTRWSIGKGLLGQAMFDAPEGEPRIVRAHEWPQEIGKYRRSRASSELGVDEVSGRKPKEMGKLRKVYASAAAVAIREAPGIPAFGCLTAHTPATRPLSEDGEYVLGEILKLHAVPLAERIREVGDYFGDAGRGR